MIGKVREYLFDEVEGQIYDLIKYAKNNMMALKKILNISSNFETFSIPFDKKPSSISIDPGVNQLFSGNISESK